MEYIYEMLIGGLDIEDIANMHKINIKEVKQELEKWIKRSEKIKEINEFIKFLSTFNYEKNGIILKLRREFEVNGNSFLIGFIDKLLSEEYCNNNYYIISYVIKVLEENYIKFQDEYSIERKEKILQTALNTFRNICERSKITLPEDNEIIKRLMKRKREKIDKESEIIKRKQKAQAEKVEIPEEIKTEDSEEVSSITQDESIKTNHPSQEMKQEEMSTDASERVYSTKKSGRTKPEISRENARIGQIVKTNGGVKLKRSQIKSSNIIITEDKKEKLLIAARDKLTAEKTIARFPVDFISVEELYLFINLAIELDKNFGRRYFMYGEIKSEQDILAEKEKKNQERTAIILAAVKRKPKLTAEQIVEENRGYFSSKESVFYFIKHFLLNDEKASIEYQQYGGIATRGREKMTTSRISDIKSSIVSSMFNFQEDEQSENDITQDQNSFMQDDEDGK